MNIFCGTSGFSYKEWKGNFYPEKYPEKDMLSYYAKRLSAVEINNTFYRIPKRIVFESWAQQVNRSFRFSIKASRKITHFQRLKETDDTSEYLFRNVKSLGATLGCILFQLPPNLKKDAERLKKFIGGVPQEFRSAFEFRHESWYDEEIYKILQDSNCALVITETDEAPEAEFIKTADWTYLRLRRTQYTEDELKTRANRVKSLNWDDIFVFFKHEDEGTGPALASKFIELSKKS